MYYAKEDYEKETKQAYTPFIPVSDLKRKVDITNKIKTYEKMTLKNIMQILNDSEVQKTKGLDLNLHENYIAEFIEFLINNATAEERSTSLMYLFHKQCRRSFFL